MFIRKPKSFDFKNTVYSHGWCELKPFSFDGSSWKITYVFCDLGTEIPLSATIFSTEKSIRIDTGGVALDRKTKINLRRKVKHILRLDEEFSEFYRLTNKSPGFSWIAEKKVGRLVRSTTVFEDLIKTICTTNCSWALTKSMVGNLVEKIGEPGTDGEKSFPTAAAMAGRSEQFYRKEIRAGYRSPYFTELAGSVARGDIKPEDWLHSEIETPELKKEMKKIKGVGEYAAENLLKLVGRYDGLALDSFLRSAFYKKYNNGKPCDDKRIEAFYSGFGEWRGLAIWFDMTKRFLD
jgi:N-glycosylase/DNA lyase